MGYADRSGNYNQSEILDGIAEIEDKIQEELTKDVIDQSKLTRLRYEEMLRGIYMSQFPFNSIIF